MKKIIAGFVLFSCCLMAHCVSIWLPLPNSGKWMKFDKVTKWTIKQNGVIEFYCNDRFYASSMFMLED